MVKSEAMGHDVHSRHVPALRPSLRAAAGRGNHAKQHAHLRRDAPSSSGIHISVALCCWNRVRVFFVVLHVVPANDM